MGALPGAPSYRQQHSSLIDRLGAIDVEAIDVTTDPEEGARQIEAMKPEPLKVGDKVRLSAGGERTMTVVELQDYDNMAVCDWDDPAAVLPEMRELRDTFPVRSLVRVDEK